LRPWRKRGQGVLKRTIKQRMQLDEISLGERFRVEYEEIEALAENIKEHGVLEPLLVSKEGVLLAGGRRYKACQVAGLSEVPVVVFDTGGREVDEREIELIENVFRKDMKWQERARLEARIFALKEEQEPGWTQRDQAAMLGNSLGVSNKRLQLAGFLDAIPGLAACETEQEAIKVIRGLQEGITVNRLAAEAKLNPAYRWAADHYHVGDCIAGMEEMHPGVVEFAEVDPPYAVDLHQHKSKLQLGAADPSIAPYQEVDAKDYPDFLKRVATQVHRILRDGSYCVWWHGSIWAGTVRSVLEAVGFRVHGVPAIWYKVDFNGQSNMPDRMLSSAFEPFWVCEKGQARLHKPGRNNVFPYQPPSASERFHPAERPIELILDILDTFTSPGQVVVSPFLGSGNTLRAAYRSHRTAFGWDLAGEYKDRFLAKVQEEHVNPADVTNMENQEEGADNE
jgi:adenine-specific DNA-methyltransferase